ncbi:pyridoxal phosphate-dependent transferase [Endogone sp. FLAS-F59071]|nr:pyridoxal phosphate-dependent transferase [Endogone sp. FLAS-F59071]|eukprot:RUS23454.1 pyridoxal phosphate-dependent transferase [Endogone sp. FLAS-F59071]
MDYTRFLNETSKNRVVSPIRAIMPLAAIPGMISLGAGNPNPSTYPYASLSITLKTGEKIDIDGKLLADALQYGPTPGMPELINWFRELQIIEHNPARKDFEISIGVGSQDLITKALEMCIEPGDNVLIETPTYAGILAHMRTLPCKLIDIATDANGIIPSSLEHTLSAWPDTKTIPKILYTIPSGSNPSGSSAPLERKREIYKLASMYNVLILEDDPYYYLQFVTPRIPSYFSFDVDGRVLRFDSISKILSGGMRIGWVSGPKALLDRINIHTSVTNLQPSGVPQVMVYGLLSHWGYEKFLAHVGNVAQFYKDKRDVFLRCAERRLKDVAEWTAPTAGMFVWIKLLGITDSNNLITTKAREKKILALPGVLFLSNPLPTPYIRISYSNVTEEEMDEGLRRLAELVVEELSSN